ncbi:site-specific integrase [Fodinicola feengrottensis]|uniref:Site-specific integrase n=1 Tax=Fodinicola feengrottensis TaxID=435914 RepID=A0ABP4U936_9ACTN|nr:site-specific integrase [Fodinicola feengrottensis]
MAESNSGETKKRRSRGDDGVYFDQSKNCWVGAISMGYAVNGKRRRPKVYGKSSTEVRDKLKELRKELETGVKPEANYTVANAVTDWLARGLKGRNKKTVTKNRQLAEKHLIPLIGKAKLPDLTADDVDDWLETRTEILATRSIRDLLAVLRRSITFAQRRDKIGRNVASLVTAPEGTEGRPSKALTLGQAFALLKAAKGSRLYAYVVLSLLTGIRTEEARALRWDHVVLVSLIKQIPPYIMVWRSVREHGDTKTRKSRRSLALPLLGVAALCWQRAVQEADRRAVGDDWSEHGLVFCTRYGKPLDAANVRRDFRGILKKAGLNPEEWTPRELRHSFVSIMSANGVALEDIARLVGHSSTATTEAVYRKELRPVITQGADVMGNLFNLLRQTA